MVAIGLPWLCVHAYTYAWVHMHVGGDDQVHMTSTVDVTFEIRRSRALYIYNCNYLILKL